MMSVTWRTDLTISDMVAPRPIDLLPSSCHVIYRAFDEIFDFLGGAGAALGERAHLARHDGKPSALFARARGFHRGVERQDVGLERQCPRLP